MLVNFASLWKDIEVRYEILVKSGVSHHSNYLTKSGVTVKRVLLYRLLDSTNLPDLRSKKVMRLECQPADNHLPVSQTPTIISEENRTIIIFVLGKN